MSWDVGDIKDVTSLRILDKSLEYWWGTEGVIGDITPNDFLSEDKSKIISAIIRTTGDPDANTIFRKYLHELHDEKNSEHPYLPLIQSLMNATWNAFIQAVGESGVNKDQTIRKVVLKGLGYSTLLSQERFIQDDYEQDSGLDSD
ncbi:MAG: hypothetical protein ACFFG0_41140 [Candidatus Thorarchaeota archaeon]